MKFLIILLSVFNIVNCSNGQQRIVIPKVTPINSLTETIQSITKEQQGCKYFEQDLIYIVSDFSKGEDFKVSITMIEGFHFLPDQMLDQIVGYFDSNNQTVLLIGERLDKLYSDVEGTKEFVYRTDYDIYPSDYSLWIYDVRDSELIESESYKLPCN